MTLTLKVSLLSLAALLNAACALEIVVYPVILLIALYNADLYGGHPL